MLNFIFTSKLIQISVTHVLLEDHTVFIHMIITFLKVHRTWLISQLRFIWREVVHRGNKARLVIGTSRTVGSAKKFVRITSGFGGGEFTKTLRKVCTYQKLKFSFLLLEYCKIRECYAVANAFTIRNMYSLFLYMKCNSRKINRPTKKHDENCDTLTFLSCSWQRCKLNFHYFFIMGV